MAGHNGMVGSAIVRVLRADGYNNLLLNSSKELDLRNQQAVNRFFEQERPEYVFLAAAKVGGIKANNDFSADFLYDNLMIEANVIHAAHTYRVKKLLFLGSSCIYPKYADQPIKEDSLLTGALEPTNEAYAIAKIAGIKLCQHYRKQYGANFISVMPTNLYGFGDNYHPENSHVLPALIRRFYEAKDSGLDHVKIWGTGTPLREFMFADDLAEACLFLMKNYDDAEIINAGSGQEISIANLAKLLAKLVGYEGKISFDSSMPDGTPRKIMDSSRISQMGFVPKTQLADGISKAIEDFKMNFSTDLSIN